MLDSEAHLTTESDSRARSSPDSAFLDPARQRASVLGFVESISSQLELRPLLTQIVRCACDLIGADRGTIGLFDPRRNLFRTEAVYHMPMAEVGAEMPPGVGLAGHIIVARGPVILDRYGDVESPVRGGRLLEDAVIGVPILRGEEMIGYFGIGSAAPAGSGAPPRRFTRADAEALAVFARHAAIAIENARRYTHEQRRTERFQLIARVARIITADLRLRDVLQNAADVIHQLLGYPSVAIELVEPADPAKLVFRARSGAPRELSEAELSVPIRVKERVLGALDIESDEPFTMEDAAGLEIVADQLGAAIENARLYESAQRLATLEERQRLARELHDSVTQQLFALTMVAQSLEPAWRRDPEEGARRGQRLLELSRAALAEMRALLAELRPAEALDLSHDAVEPVTGIGRVRRDGLPQALRNYTRSAQFDGIELRLETRGYRRQPEPVENALYWISREALHNVVKHARASAVELRLASEDGMARLLVADDGVGFDPGATPEARADGSGLGLSSMRDRTEALGGHFTLRSAPGAGTRVIAAIPLLTVEES
jgi:signal transduction histidine kinase